MTDEAGEHVGNGLAWLGFWIFLGFFFISLDGPVVELNFETRDKAVEVAE